MQNAPGPEEIQRFVERRHGRRLGPLEASDVLAALDLDGAGAEAFMAEFAQSFEVDLAGYEPQFHHRDVARAGRLGWPMPVPLLFGVRLPVAVSVLAEAAASGRWPVRYPQLAPVRGRDWLNAPFVLAALPVAAAAILGLFAAF
jgi:hypothetical protein